MNDKSPKCKIPEEDVTEIIPGLWLGNEKSSCCSKFLNKYNIKHIICILPKKETKYPCSLNRAFSNISYVHIPIVDSDTCSKDLNKLYDTVNRYILHALKNKEAVLVHCKRGHHRSGCIVAAFLVKHVKITFDEAVFYINRIRPCAMRRDTCMTRGLLKYYQSLNTY